MVHVGSAWYLVLGPIELIVDKVQGMASFTHTYIQYRLARRQGETTQWISHYSSAYS